MDINEYIDYLKNTVFVNIEKSFLSNLKEIINEDELGFFFKKIKENYTSDFKKKWDESNGSYTKELNELLTNNKIVLLTNVNQRLTLIDIIDNYGQGIYEREDGSIGNSNKNDEVKRHKQDRYRLFQQLKIYLALTCFDQLGQPFNGWKEFDSWIELKTKGKNRQIGKERDAIFQKAFDEFKFKLDKKRKEKFQSKSFLKKLKITFKIVRSLFVPDSFNTTLFIDKEFEDDYKKCLKEVFKNYKEIFGVKKSFYRFIEEVLPAKNRSKLLSTIMVDDGTYLPKNLNHLLYEDSNQKESKDDLKEKEKKDWLYSSRNNFTHNAFSSEGKQMEEQKIFDNKIYSYRKTFFKNQGEIDYKVYVNDDFYYELINCIKVGIVEVLQDFTSNK